MVAGDPESITGKEIRRHRGLMDGDDPWWRTWWRLRVARTSIFAAPAAALVWLFARGDSAWSGWSPWLWFGIFGGLAAVAALVIVFTRCPRCGRHFAVNLEMGNIFTGKCLHCGLRQWTPVLIDNAVADQSSHQPPEVG